jgi:hypothetical protein
MCRHEKELLENEVKTLRNHKEQPIVSGLHIDLTIEENKVEYFRTFSSERHTLLYEELLSFMPHEPPNSLYTNPLLLDMFFFMFTTGLSCNSTSKALLVQGKRVSRQTIRNWMDRILENLAKWGQSKIKWPTPEEWQCDSSRILQKEEYSDYAKKLFFFVDGSVLKLFDTSDIRISRDMRNGKHGCSAFVFFIMVTPAGRIVYVSEDIREGTCHDKTHFLEDGVVVKVEKEYPSHVVMIDSIEYQLVLGGDKAYPFAPLPKGWHWYITKSGEDTKDVNQKGEEVGKRASKASLPNVIFDPGFARLRSVVERSIGRVKAWPIFSAPHHLDTKARAQQLLLISIGLLNWQFEKGYLERI